MSNNDLKVALYPQHIIWEDKERNLRNLEAAMSSLHPETDLLVLPETFSTGFPAGDKESIRRLAERNTGPTIEKLKALSQKHNVAIAGSFIADSGGSLYNRAFFIEPSGEETFADKRHLFTMAGEDKSFSRGYDRMSVRYRGWNIAMVICYDIRFPVWCRNVLNSYDLLIAVANWPVARVNAWNQLLIARAIENESYVIGVDCKGKDTNGFEYDGSSSVIDFKGKSMGIDGKPFITCSDGDNPFTQDAIQEKPDSCSAPVTEHFIYAALSHEKLQAFRAKFPAWKDADIFRLG